MTPAARSALRRGAVAFSALVGLVALLAGNLVAAAAAGVTVTLQLVAAWRMRRAARRPLRIPRRTG